MAVQSIKIIANGLTNIFKTTNLYYKPFAIYGSGTGGKIPTGTTYTVHTAIDDVGKLMPDPLYTDCTEVLQDVFHRYCGIFSLEIKNLPAGGFLIVEYKIFDTPPAGAN